MASSSSPHNENLVRPETAGVPNQLSDSRGVGSALGKASAGGETAGRPSPELVFFNTFFCPYAQMAWIALNEKGIAAQTEFVEGLTIRGGDYEVHPRLRALRRSGVPTLHHPASGTVVDGSTECVEFIDRTFGEPHQLLPEDRAQLRRARRCESLLHSEFTFPFYSMLLRQEPDKQEEAKRNLTQAVETLVEGYVGPYYLGERFSVADIAVAPYFDRMIVLEHYRNFRVSEGGTTARWHEWSANVLGRPSVMATQQDKERIIEAYKRYAKCYVRNNWYHRVFHQGY